MTHKQLNLIFKGLLCASIANLTIAGMTDRREFLLAAGVFMCMAMCVDDSCVRVERRNSEFSSRRLRA